MAYGFGGVVEKGGWVVGGTIIISAPVAAPVGVTVGVTVGVSAEGAGLVIKGFGIALMGDGARRLKGNSKLRDAKETSKRFGNKSTKVFERKTKRKVMEDIKVKANKNKKLKQFLERNKNPNIIIDDNEITLQSVVNKETIDTGLKATL